MHPVFFQIGPLTLRWYGLMIAIACMAGLWVAKQEARRNQIETQKVETFFLFAVLFAVMGARFYYIAFTEPALFWKNPFAVLAIWEGGLAIHGAIIGGVLTGIVYTWRQKISFWKFADTLAPSLAIGQAIGRIGCFLNGDAHGYPTTMPWGLIYSPESPAGQMYPGQTLHPTQLYEMVFNLIIFGVLWAMRKKIKTSGHLFLLYTILYSAGRIFVEHFRADKLTYLGNISAAQSIGVLGILTAVILMILLRKKVIRI
ncbi:prolipoprotein diacylglyceryl transferase [Desulfobacula sp.]|uniref:prolipoprotein diacylglyceryl transferase n=1 Tax=Desulfobacula sp. TaxID=2593537 RepID=UPI002637F598|nr:prolipoprotein diacylglyceryl transferase [Desulfobacula sp.]